MLPAVLIHSLPLWQRTASPSLFALQPRGWAQPKGTRSAWIGPSTRCRSAPITTSSSPQQHLQGWSMELQSRDPRGAGMQIKVLCALLSFILALTVNHSEHEGREAEANQLHSISHPEVVAQFLAQGSRAAALKDPQWHSHHCYGHCFSYQEHTSRADHLLSWFAIQNMARSIYSITIR